MVEKAVEKVIARLESANKKEKKKIHQNLYAHADNLKVKN